MNIIVGHRQDFRKGEKVEAYSHVLVEDLISRGHKVLDVGEGFHDTSIADLSEEQIRKYDLLLDIDCGRNQAGELVWQREKIDKLSFPSAVWFIDSHGNPTLHKRLAVKYDHVFFAVWSKRDLFIKHPSAHWLPNATSLKWFGHVFMQKLRSDPPRFDIGFFGSKHGLDRADTLKTICEKNDWTYDIREVGKPFRHKWPQTGQAMFACRNLFNHGQKHDGPNQRVIESMAMNRPLLTDMDPKDGMSKLFVEGYHYIGYPPGFMEHHEEVLEERLKWMIENPRDAIQLADRAYKEVCEHHLIGSRVNNILNVVDAKHAGR